MSMKYCVLRARQGKILYLEKLSFQSERKIKPAQTRRKFVASKMCLARNVKRSCPERDTQEVRSLCFVKKERV